MLVVKRGRWDEAHLLFFIYKRIYIRGRPVPLCIIKYRKKPEDWFFLERVWFMVSCWFANLERKIK